MITIKSAKNKGREYEKAVIRMIREKGLDHRARRTGGSGSGLEKGDVSTVLRILGRNVNIECKNQKTMSFQTWWRQTEKQAMNYAEPLLVFKFDREPMEASKAVIYLETLLDLIKKAQEPKMANQDRELKWKIQRFIDDGKALLKELEG